MALAAITVHFENPEQTSRLIDSLQKFDAIERIVVILHGEYPQPKDTSRVTFIRQENQGYAAGLNRAVNELRKHGPEVDLVLAINPDVNFEYIRMNELVESHKQSQADCTFPAIQEGNRVIHGYEFTSLGTMRLVETGALTYSGACFLFNVAAWEKVSGFNEQYFHYYEDADFCMRLQRAGCCIHHAASVVFQHVGKSGADYPTTALPRYAVRNHLLFLSNLGRLSTLAFMNVSIRHLLYLFRWKHGWRGIGEWYRGIQEFRHL